MKTFDKKDVYSVLNAEEASEYVGTEGYFSYTLSALKEKVQKNILATLDDINQLCDYPFITHNEGALFFLPASKVKKVEKEKKWRAFEGFEEFIVVLGTIGCHVRYRLKADRNNEFLASINGFNYKAQSITINAVRYTFTELFDKFEFYKNQKWQPFGVEE